MVVFENQLCRKRVRMHKPDDDAMMYNFVSVGP